MARPIRLCSLASSPTTYLVKLSHGCLCLTQLSGLCWGHPWSGHKASRRRHATCSALCAQAPASTLFKPQPVRVKRARMVQQTCQHIGGRAPLVALLGQNSVLTSAQRRRQRCSAHHTHDAPLQHTSTRPAAQRPLQTVYIYSVPYTLPRTHTLQTRLMVVHKPLRTGAFLEVSHAGHSHAGLVPWRGGPMRTPRSLHALSLGFSNDQPQGAFLRPNCTALMPCACGYRPHSDQRRAPAPRVRAGRWPCRRAAPSCRRTSCRSWRPKSGGISGPPAK